MKTFFYGLALAVLGAACRPAAPPPPAPVTDDLARTVAVVPPALRVVPLAPSLTEMIVAAGGADRLAAITQVDDYPPSILDRPRFTTWPLDTEALIALKPDLVLGTDQVNNPAEGDRLAALGLPTAYFSFRTLADVPRVLRRLGTLLGTDSTAEAAARAFEADLAAHPPAADGPRVLVLIGDDVLYSFGGASYVHDLVRRAGGRSLSAALPGESVTLSAEWVVQQAPEVIFLADTAPDPHRRLWARYPAWRRLPALKERRVYGLDPNLLVRPGPRLVEGRAAMADALLPLLADTAP